MVSNKIGLVTGGFDPLHSGHIDMIQYAAEQCSYLVVGVNSDEWLIRKKGEYLMPLNERVTIMQSLRGVHEVITFDDSDDTACNAIARVREDYPHTPLRFFNGGDRDASNTFEVLKYSNDPEVEFVFGAGGDYKKAASSEILQNWFEKKLQTTQRNWGVYNVLLEHENTKLKTLVVDPKKSLSMQKHEYRSEHWYVVEGSGILEYQPSPKADIMKVDLDPHNIITIPCGCWHKLHNIADEVLSIIEIQYGEKCVESDITRAEKDK